MIVHEVSAFQELHKVVIADVDGDGEADGRPEREASAHPVPELEHVRLVNAEVFHFGGVCGQGDEVFCHGRFLHQTIRLVY